ncbi:MAG: M20/M25/M40 family metallo-hydrolase, partial [Pirellulaceae bacterium]|nr:M20/M25/M40 family metallo-hydrolase [Pirellulaceae bacterium]
MNSVSAQTEAHAWLAANQSRWTSELIELANVNSGSANLVGLNEVADMLSAWSGVPALPAQRIALPPRRGVAGDGHEQAMETGVALKWEVRPQANQRVLLGIHYDTVYLPTHQPAKCQHVTDARLVGPGTADAKGGIIVARAALEALEHFCLAPEVGWTLLLTPDEEVGSPSSAELWDSLARTHDYGLLFEPALPSGALVGQRKGSGNFTVVVRGRAAHAGRDFAAGRNAIALASQLASALDRLNGKHPDTTINLGNFTGGGAVNVVPDLAILRWNVRVPDAAAQHWFERQLSDILEEADQQEGFQVALYGGFTAPPKPMTHAQREL